MHEEKTTTTTLEKRMQTHNNMEINITLRTYKWGTVCYHGEDERPKWISRIDSACKHTLVSHRKMIGLSGMCNNVQFRKQLQAKIKQATTATTTMRKRERKGEEEKEIDRQKAYFILSNH